jgi:hypothetical protein
MAQFTAEMPIVFRGQRTTGEILFQRLDRGKQLFLPSGRPVR